MRGKSRSIVLTLTLTVAALCSTSCQKAPPEDQRDPPPTELHSADTVVEAKHEVTLEANGYFATVRREQLDLRARLHEEIDELDEELAAAPPSTLTTKDAARARANLERRGKLAAYLTAVEHSDERGWDLLKATVERELANKPAGKI